ncbi:MAG TPA: UDP-N-acetylmuramoyl-L-alanyl-D-glutamate--2,6-diaminopimelate ligase, partial [Cryomorphaceae bacterium]|nr:UDP-N-acetylmuramoyl-L-alanyl-D-glutamate--2,6-diaminopimelate ligase [Cryomorphaceae bacterium]
LENVLKTLQDLNQGAQQIITVIGCGGDRDKGKRPEMARIAADRSTKAILTSDNPRSEDPEAILDDMEAGLDPVQKRRTLRISDRAQAIKLAVQLANPGDVILVAGKGHETYQEIAGVKHPFDDAAILKAQFNDL